MSRRAPRRLVLRGAHDAGKREVHPFDDVRQFDVVAVLRGRLDLRAAGVGPADVAGELVEGVADAGVHRLAEDAVAAVAVAQKVGVRAGGVEAHRRVEARAVAAHFEVGDHVVHADQRHVEPLGDRPGGRGDDSQAGSQPRTAGKGDGVDRCAVVSVPAGAPAACSSAVSTTSGWRRPCARRPRAGGCRRCRAGTGQIR